MFKRKWGKIKTENQTNKTKANKKTKNKHTHTNIYALIISGLCDFYPIHQDYEKTTRFLWIKKKRKKEKQTDLCTHYKWSIWFLPNSLELWENYQISLDTIFFNVSATDETYS